MQIQPAKSRRKKEAPSVPQAQPSFRSQAEAYMAGVLDGSIFVSPRTRQTYERHRRDLVKSRSESFPYVFVPEAGEHVLEFLACLPHVEGDLAGQLFKPEPWQSAAVLVLYGWRVKGDESRRRFRRGSWFCPRGNGKTFLGAGLGIYHAFADGEGGAASFSFARTKDQARLSWIAAQRMLKHEKAAKLRERLGLEVGQHAIYQERTSSTFKALASESDSLDGLNVSFGLGDEVSQHPDRDLYDVIATATAKRSTSLLLTISTASGNTESVGRELWTDCEKVLDGTVVDESFFALIYELPPEMAANALTSEKAWRAANPNYGISVQPDVFSQLMENARQNPSARPSVLTRLLNVWVSADAAYYDLGDFDACIDRERRPEDFASSVAFAAYDLATKWDLNCVGYVVPFPHEDTTHYAVWVDTFLNSVAANDSKSVNYPRWMESGAINVNPGNVTDFRLIEESIIRWSKSLVIESVSYDRHQGEYIAQRLQDLGLVGVLTPMTTGHLAAPMKEFSALMKQRRIHFVGNCDVLRWCVGNVVSHYDARGNPYPRKERDESKIDAAIVVMLALGRAIVAPPPAGSDFHVV